MFWMAAASAELICWPDCSVVMMVPMFNAIWVSAGKSASAILIHWALQPVASSEIDKTIARTVLDFEIELRSEVELNFMMELLLGFGWYWFRVLTICRFADYNAMQAATGNLQLK